MDNILKSDEILEKLKALKARDQQVQVDEDTLQIIIVLLGETIYALPAEHAFEIGSNSRIYPVPGTPDYVRGVQNLRGDIATVLCLRSLMQLARDELVQAKRVVYCQIEGNVIGFLVDNVEDVVDFPVSGIKKTMVTLDKYKKDVVQGELTFNDQLVLLLNVHSLYEKALSGLSASTGTSK
ncbi:purine-binding chemotaxis protein CheW [bacterium]|nr:purine-binding chemotaxis protein CheW [bacterium]